MHPVLFKIPLPAWALPLGPTLFVLAGLGFLLAVFGQRRGALDLLVIGVLALLPWADVAVPSLASGLLLTRIGCYLFGCDFGKPLGIGAPAWLKRLGTFPRWPSDLLDGAGSPAWMQHVNERGLSITSRASLPVHPTELYES